MNAFLLAQFPPFLGRLFIAHLESAFTLYPNPLLASYAHSAAEHGALLYHPPHVAPVTLGLSEAFPKDISVLGFLPVAAFGSPPIVARFTVLPVGKPAFDVHSSDAHIMLLFEAIYRFILFGH